MKSPSFFGTRDLCQIGVRGWDTEYLLGWWQEAVTKGEISRTEPKRRVGRRSLWSMKGKQSEIQAASDMSIRSGNIGIRTQEHKSQSLEVPQTGLWESEPGSRLWNQEFNTETGPDTAVGRRGEARSPKGNWRFTTKPRSWGVGVCRLSERGSQPAPVFGTQKWGHISDCIAVHLVVGLAMPLSPRAGGWEGQMDTEWGGMRTNWNPLTPLTSHSATILRH